MSSLLWIICLWQVAVAPVEAEPQAAGAKWAAYYQRAASGYEVRELSPESKSPTQRVELAKSPVLSWTSLNDYDGAVFAWTRAGRPVMFATIFSFPSRVAQQRQVVHEFLSFAEVPLAVSSKDAPAWSPEPLSTWSPLPDRPPVGTTDNQIKLQARNLARRFSGRLNRLGESWELRLLPKPLIEYGKVGDSVLGGGVFAFVGYSTDPEILVMLEARKTPQGTQWYYAPGRFSDKSLYLSYRDQPIWESLRRGHGSDAADEPDGRYQVLQSQSVDAGELR